MILATNTCSLQGILSKIIIVTLIYLPYIHPCTLYIYSLVMYVHCDVVAKYLSQRILFIFKRYVNPYVDADSHNAFVKGWGGSTSLETPKIVIQRFFLNMRPSHFWEQFSFESCEHSLLKLKYFTYFTSTNGNILRANKIQTGYRYLNCKFFILGMLPFS